MEFDRLVLQPVFSEKSLAEAKRSRYIFKVFGRANKSEVRKRLEKDFGVKIAAVRSLRVLGKRKKLRNQREVKKEDFKKFIVVVRTGKIDIFDKN